MHRENEMSNRSKNIWWNLTTGNCPYISKTELWINNKHAATLLKTNFPPFLQYRSYGSFLKMHETFLTTGYDAGQVGNFYRLF